VSAVAVGAVDGSKPVGAPRSARWRELGVTLEMLVGLVEQVSVDLGASP
jgi:hypothetical protein